MVAVTIYCLCALLSLCCLASQARLHARQPVVPQMMGRLAGRPGGNRAHSVLCTSVAHIKDFISRIHCLATGRPASREMVVAHMLCCLLLRGVPTTCCIRSHCWAGRHQASRAKAVVATCVYYSEACLRNPQTLLNKDILLGRRWWAGWQRSVQQQSRPCRACWCGMVPRTASCTPLTYPSSPSCTLAECCSASCWPSTNPSLRCPNCHFLLISSLHYLSRALQHQLLAFDTLCSKYPFTSFSVVQSAIEVVCQGPVCSLVSAISSSVV